MKGHVSQNWQIGVKNGQRSLIFISLFVVSLHSLLMGLGQDQHSGGAIDLVI